MKKSDYLSSNVMLYTVAFVMLGGLFVMAQAGTRTLWGEPKELGNSTARSFVVMNDQGKPVSIGISFTKEALSGLPTEAEPPEVMLALPGKADVHQFKYIVINWNPQGHEPKMYLAPHFDFHFYLMPNEEREKISENDAVQFAKTPPSQYLPADYMQAPGGIPRMGAHCVDKTAPELQGKPFRQTFIYGTYDGEVTFYEPMVSMAFLETQTDFSAPIKQPAAFEKDGFYPTTYRIKYDKKHGEYRVSLDGLTLH